MATPMTAGVAALVKQAHPTWNGLQIKAAVMNTADATLNVGYNVRRAGAGVVQAQRAVNSSVLATTADQLHSIAFGYLPGSGSTTVNKSFTLTNYGTAAATYSLSVSSQASAGSTITVSPTSVTIAAGGSATVQVTKHVAQWPSAAAREFFFRLAQGFELVRQWFLRRRQTAHRTNVPVHRLA